MATQNRGVQIPITAKDETASAVKSVESRLKGLEGKLLGINKAAGSVRTAFSGIAAVVSVGAFTSLVKSTVDAVGALGDVANRTGVAREDLQKLQYAAKLSGVEFGTLEGALSKLNGTLGKAKGGDKSANELLKNLGIDPASTKDAKSALLQLAEGFKELGDSPEALQTKAAALKALKLDPTLIPLLDQGASSIESMGDELVRLGGLIDDETVKSIEALGDKLDMAATKGSGLATIFVSGLEPALSGILDSFFKAEGGTNSFRKAGELLGDVLRGLVTTGDFVATRFGNLGRLLGAAAAQARALATGDFDGARQIGQQYIADKNAAIKAQQQRQEVRNAAPAAAPSTTPTGSSSTGTGKGRINAKGLFADGADAKKAAEEQLKIAKAQAEAIVKLRVDAEKRSQEGIKNALDDGEITYAEYFKALTESQDRAIDARIEGLKKEQTAADKAGKKSESIKIASEIKELEEERFAIAGKAAREQAKAEKDLADELKDVEFRTKEILGTITPEDRKAILDKKYAKLEEEALKAGRSTAPIKQLKTVEAAQSEYDAIVKKMEEARSKADEKISRVGVELDAGILSSSDARSKIAEANRQAAASIDDLIPKLQAQADILGGDYVTKAKEAQTELMRLKQASDEVANAINKDIQSGISDAIYGLATGEKSPAQALKDLFKGVGNSIARQVADDLASSLYKLLKTNGFDIGKMISDMISGSSGGSGGGSGGGIAGAIGGAFTWFKGLLGYEQGGYTGNLGTRQVAGAVHGQEYVMSAPAVRTLGVGFLDAFHSAARRGAPRTNLAGFADGGFAKSPRGGFGGTTNVAMTVVTPNAQSFRNSQAQIEAAQGRAMTRAGRRAA